MEKNGQIIEPGVLRFQRLLNGSLETVWAYLVESEKRGKLAGDGGDGVAGGGNGPAGFFA
ncbi:hypothetical protein ACQ86N_38960 [Puia sp. P3]|uniref:hypothetical protein n=1 Tax=Puia sp. P3 TaxID=3423952 RepID=UPI003D671954